MELTRVRDLSTQALDEVERAVVGKREPLELVLLGFLADGHVLLEDYPGLAKTLAAPEAFCVRVLPSEPRTSEPEWMWRP